MRYVFMMYGLVLLAVVTSPGQDATVSRAAEPEKSTYQEKIEAATDWRDKLKLAGEFIAEGREKQTATEAGTCAPEERDRLLAEARASFEATKLALGDVQARLKRELLGFIRSIPDDRPDLVRYRDELRAYYVRTAIETAAIERGIATTYPQSSDEFKHHTQAALDLYTELAKKYEDRIGGFWGQLGRARCLIDLDHHREAMVVIDEIWDGIDRESIRQYEARVVALAGELVLAECTDEITDKKRKLLTNFIKVSEDWLEGASQEEQESVFGLIARQQIGRVCLVAAAATPVEDRDRKKLFSAGRQHLGYVAGLVEGSPQPAVEKPLAKRVQRRTWADATGGRKTEAILLAFKKGYVQLQKTDGRLVSMPANRLNEADIAYVATELAAARIHSLDRTPLNLPDSAEVLLRFVARAAFDLAGREPAERARLVREKGGTAASEAAVGAALKWLAAHQYPDGSWNFDHSRASCAGRCSHPGIIREAPRAATAMALLPMLGAGHTHMKGDYQATVKDGLNFLVRNMKVRGGTGSLEDPGGGMYSHGLGTIVLCEAYAMTRDKGLMQPAQLALNHIAYAQDPVGGGWRYRPKQPGDTSVTGWQVLALRAGHSAGLRVDPNTLKGARKFLDSVQMFKGARYGYTRPTTSRKSTTAIGLLCRMHLGWKRDRPALVECVSYLSDMGPSPDRMYYNYFATRVLRKYEGNRWKKWNASLRDDLIAAQAKTGHEAGSWHFEGMEYGAERAGRLFYTSLAALILESYYRYLPVDGPRDGDAGRPAASDVGSPFKP